MNPKTTIIAMARNNPEYLRLKLSIFFDIGYSPKRELFHKNGICDLGSKLIEMIGGKRDVCSVDKNTSDLMNSVVTKHGH